MDQHRAVDRTDELWAALQRAKAHEDQEQVRQLEGQLRTIAAQRDAGTRTRPVSRWRRVLRNRFARGALVGVVVAVGVLLSGLAGEALAVRLVSAGFLGFAAAAVGVLAQTPNAPHNPNAAREDRAFNYVRGEGGGV